jgi:hypothetical protein
LLESASDVTVAELSTIWPRATPDAL